MSIENVLELQRKEIDSLTQELAKMTEDRDSQQRVCCDQMREVERLKETIHDHQAWLVPIQDAYDPRGNTWKDIRSTRAMYEV